jgi:hypothetical protein
METRYPMPKPISDSFPIPEAPGFTHAPLSSSGFTKFVYALCSACFFNLAKNVGFSKVLADFRNLYGTREPFQRFNRLLWGDRCKDLLEPCEA